MRGLSSECDFQHRGDQRGGHAVSGDVGYENAYTFVVRKEEIVEIAGDGAHGDVACGDFESCEDGNALRKNGGLNLAGNFQLFVDCEEPFFVCEDAARGNVTEARDENQETHKLDVVPRQDMKAHEIFLDDEDNPNDETGDKHANFAG